MDGLVECVSVLLVLIGIVVMPFNFDFARFPLGLGIILYVGKMVWGLVWQLRN